MTRIIKFRYWDELHKEMMDWSDLKRQKFIEFLENAEPPIMQFTGLLDKNGKEIFEGDIVKFRDIDNSLPEEILPVIWDEKACGFVCRDSQHSKGIDMASSYDTISGEIIGNVYENPELLK